jgi:hypothetical protein
MNDTENRIADGKINETLSLISIGTISLLTWTLWEFSEETPNITPS